MPWTVAVILLSVAPAAHAVSDGGVVVTYSESLENLSLNTEAAQQAIGGAPSGATLIFDALGQRFEVTLEPNDRLLAGAPGRARDLGIYRGKLAGKPDSWARITMADGIPTGLIWDGAEMLAIEASPDGTSIYRLKDTYVEAGTLSCGVPGEGPDKTSLATAYAAVTGELQTVIAQAPGAVEELKIGVVSDFEFTRSIGFSNVDAAVLTRMNNVDGIFSSQLGVQITVEVIDKFADSNDPFTTDVPNDLLDELADYRVLTSAQNSQGLTFMFTGRNLDGTTAGIAYRDVLCSTRFGVGLSEGVRNATTDSLIAAHEIGHNFGAQHDGEAGSVCESVTGDFLMAPSVNGNDQFSSCSIDTIRPRINAASCINALAQTDVAIALTNAPSRLLLGASADLIFSVSNSGTGNATNVAATFALPTNLAINSVATTVGSCTSGAGQVSCAIGTIAGGGNASVALSLTANSVGTDTLNASVVADGDADLNNNSDVVSIVVEEGTNLRIANVASRTVALNSTFTTSPRIENISTLAASNLTLTVSYSSGLRLDSASWPNGTCSIGADSFVTCQRSSLAAGTSVSVDIQFTATADGSQSYRASVSSTEADANTSDNSANANIVVTTGTGGGSDSGGGGSVSLFWLLVGLIARCGARLSRR